MANEPSDPPSPRRTGVVIAIAAGLVLVVAAAVAVVVGLQPNGVGPMPSGTPSASGGTSAPLPSAAPSEPATPGDMLAPADPVEIDEEAEITPGLSAEITAIEAVEGEARRPGEVGGPAIRVTVQISNSTDAAASLATTVVTAYYGADRIPALELGAPGAVAIPSEVAAGGSATGVYVFTVPPEERDRVQVMVDYSVDVQPLVFEGVVPR